MSALHRKFPPKADGPKIVHEPAGYINEAANGSSLLVTVLGSGRLRGHRSSLNFRL
jgi:hypothetical protein